MTEKGRPAFLDPLHPLPFRVEEYLVLPALNRIERGEEVHQIEPRVMQVLVCLAARPNEVLPRQILFDVVWADSVVCEEALTRTISELRRVFRDDTKTPRVIETIRKGGYRLIAPVTPAPIPAMPTPVPIASVSPEAAPTTFPTADVPPMSVPATPEAAQAAPASEPQPGLPPREERSVPAVRSGMRTRALAGVVGILVLALVPLSIWGVRKLMRTASAPALMEARPLTSSPGLEVYPALSPDGSMVAFSWAGEDPRDGRPLDIYVMKVRNGSPVRLTSLPGSEFSPSWSPDGTEIVFSNESEGAHGIFVVPVLGGPVRKLAGGRSTITGLDWSPDGRIVAYGSGDSSNAIPRIHILFLDDLTQRDLTSPPQHALGDLDPAFSPDGRSVAFIRVNELQGQDAYVVPIEGGEARRIEIGGMRVSGVDWLSGKQLIISAASKIEYGLWGVRIDSDERTRLLAPGGWMQRVSMAQMGRHLVYEKISFARDIWCMDISPAGAFRLRPDPFIASTQRESEPVFSPDGRSVAFVSDRSGSPEIWIADSSGDVPRKLTDHQATQLAHPRWSPDGRRIAYSCNADGVSTIYLIEIESQVARKLSQGGPQILSVWSRDGDDLYLQVDAAGGWQVWRVRPDGTGRTRISEAGYTIVGESIDGKSLLCLKSGEPGIWTLPVDGGPSSLLIPGERCKGWEEAIPTEEGLYYIRRGADASTLWFYDFATTRSDSMATLPWYAASLALSPDRSKLLFDCIGKIEVDLMTAEVRE